MNYQINRHSPETSYQTSRVLEDLVQAYQQDKKGIRYVRFDAGKATFQKCRPHEVLSFGIAYEDHHTGSVRVLMSDKQNVPPFSMIFRTKKSANSVYLVFENGLELSSDGQANFVAFFCVKYKELEDVALYTITKWGTDSCCTENYSTENAPPAHFCCATFALLGGRAYERT